jgi:hypothetical protein
MLKIRRLNDNPLPVSPGISTPFAPLIRVIRPCAAAWVASNRRDENLVKIITDERKESQETESKISRDTGKTIESKNPTQLFILVLELFCRCEPYSEVSA